MGGVLLSCYFAGALRRRRGKPRDAAHHSADVTALGFNSARISRKRIRQMVGVTLSDYLADKHDTHLAVLTQVCTFHVGTLFANRDRHVDCRWGGFRRRVRSCRSLAYEGSPVLGRFYSPAVRRAAIFCNLADCVARRCVTHLVSPRVIGALEGGQRAAIW